MDLLGNCQMKMSTGIPNLSLTSVLQSSVLILISNLIYIGNNYLVAWTGLQAPEIALVRGIIQIVIFGVVFHRERQGEKEAKSGEFISGIIKNYE